MKNRILFFVMSSDSDSREYIPILYMSQSSRASLNIRMFYWSKLVRVYLHSNHSNVRYTFAPSDIFTMMKFQNDES